MSGNNYSIKTKDARSSEINAPTAKLHARNIHQGRYDLALLCKRTPSLKAVLEKSPDGKQTINFNDSHAVLLLNQALLAQYYHVDLWQIPENYLCPPIPGRADYVHYLADLLAEANGGDIPKGKNTKVLDVGCGANCIYPIIGSQIYGWKFLGSDIDQVAVNCAKNIVQSNSALKNHIKIVQQKNISQIFKGVINDNDYYDLTMCNPPFYESLEQAQKNNQRKQKNLLKSKSTRKKVSHQVQNPLLKDRNFGGQNTELWCLGGERQFIVSMIEESCFYKQQVGWFTSLISKKDNIETIKKALKVNGATKTLFVNMAQGNKMSRFVAWSFS